MAKCDLMVMESKLPFSSNTDDGLFIVTDVDGQGNVTGKYRSQGNEENIQNGKCKENEKKLHLERAGFKYDGDIFSFNGDGIIVVVGKRSPKPHVKREKDKEADGDEVWVGVKTGT